MGADYRPLWSGELAIRVLLAEIQHHKELSLKERRDPTVVLDRVLLLANLLRLRERIG